MKNLLKKFIPNFLLSWYHFGWALLGALVFRFPSRKLKVIGVTGTNGKSTVVSLISKILEENGYGVASLSSIEFKIKSGVWPNNLKMTMPGRLKLQSFFRKAVKARCHYAVLEVTSEGIKQHRHRFIDFDAAVLTNLTKEHLESHGGFRNYKEAKGKLFQSLKKDGKAIVNLDDKSADYFLGFKAEEKYGYGIDFKSSRVDKLVRARNIELSKKGVHFSLGEVSFNLNLLGRFNVYNSLAAITVCLAEGMSLEDIKEGIEQTKGIPGRLEIVIKNPITVIVDYAHTPDALEKVYQTIKESFSGRIVGVLGAAGGGRDKWKRPEMGKIAEKYLNKIIVTNEDPYNEDPNQILSEIKSGISNDKIQSSSFHEILDRREAIRKALKSAQPEDIVIITGKGCEPWMVVANGKKIPWDDRKVVKEEFNKLA